MGNSSYNIKFIFLKLPLDKYHGNFFGHIGR